MTEFRFSAAAALRAAAKVPAVLLLAVGLGACAVDVDLPERFAVIYGVADYVADPLTYTDDDAASVGALLTAKDFPPGNIFLRLNVAATKTQLAADIAAVAAMAGKDSLFVFYFSGHGKSYTLGGSEPAPQDAYNEYIFMYHASDVYLGGLRDDELMTLISTVPSRQKVVIIDACNSGGFIGWSPDTDLVPAAYDGDTASALSAAGDAFAKYFANPQAGDIPFNEAIVITAAGEREFSYEAAGYDHGVFTYYLLASPRGADRNRDGFITATEAYAYAKDGISSVWNTNFPSASFLPHISGGALDFVLFEAD